MSIIFKNSASFCCCTYILRISEWSEKLGFLKDGTYQMNTKVFFVQLMTAGKKILARAAEIQTETGGNHQAYFRDRKCHTLFCILRCLDLW